MSDATRGLAPRAVGGILLTVVALGVVAGAVGTGSVPEPAEPPSTSPDDGGLVGGSGLGAVFPACPTPLRSGLAAGAALLAVVVATVAVATRRSPLVPVALGVPAVLYVGGSCPLPLPDAGPTVPLPAVSGRVLAVLALVVLALPAVAVLVAALRVGVREAQLPGGDGGDEEPLAAVGETAGAAADRIEDASPVANEVYRAWEAMVRHLDVEDPETATPAAFADAAVAAGMDPDDVSRLTRLFEDVRYGGRDPADREAAAVETLRRIEDTYATGESP